MRELDLFVDTLRSSEGELLDLGRELSSLFKKLPPDYRQGEAGIGPDDPRQIRALVDQAHALLVQRFKKETAAP